MPAFIKSAHLPLPRGDTQHMSVCLSVCQQNTLKHFVQILMKFSQIF